MCAIAVRIAAPLPWFFACSRKIHSKSFKPNWPTLSRNRSSAAAVPSFDASFTTITRTRPKSGQSASAASRVRLASTRYCSLYTGTTIERLNLPCIATIAYLLFLTSSRPSTSVHKELYGHQGRGWGRHAKPASKRAPFPIVLAGLQVDSRPRDILVSQLLVLLGSMRVLSGPCKGKGSHLTNSGCSPCDQGS